MSQIAALFQETRELHERIVRQEQRLSRLILSGVVAAVKAEPYKVQVNVAPDGEEQQLTAFVPVAQHRASLTCKLWAPVDVGTAGLLISPSGITSSGFFIPSFFSTAVAPPLSAATRGSSMKLVFGDVVVVIDRATKKVTVDGDVRINGGLSVSGDVVTDAGISHNSHTHAQKNGNDLGGGVNTGTPQ